MAYEVNLILNISLQSYDSAITDDVHKYITDVFIITLFKIKNVIKYLKLKMIRQTNIIYNLKKKLIKKRNCFHIFEKIQDYK